MTDEEKAAEVAKAVAEAAAIAKAAEDKKAADEAEVNAATTLLTAKDAEIAKLQEDLGNYKNVALKRLGKLPGDAGFVAGDEDTGLTVEEQVKAALLEREISIKQAEKDTEIRRLAKENAELRLAAKNRPGDATGGGSGGPTTEVKDNTFSPAQLEELKKRAIKLKADPEKFIENARKNLQARG